MASSMKITIIACLCFVALTGVKGQPISSPTLVTQYLTVACNFYAKESASGCDFENVIEDVKEYAENLATPPSFPNWDGNQVETYLDMAEKGTVYCTVQGGAIRSACAAMEAVCGPSKVNLVRCQDVTPAPPPTNPAPNTTMSLPTNQPPMTA
ncbi:uncharacterized protein LOC105442049 [Strongylocentrotus purpuratus]|uniref:Uncharacterized protein n=1 Tax=Strongylocentrotus purpuratus TaxID=7668 RepID=A0A7M7HJ56_STRPU|nr:uncharacterized protein LOC105442049 [Strongylocentrotus purpuratus]|eukprot:XP_011672110.1 PREDICTED: uncharacterized protein LOC105442049 [Strongylocentrotus purpuratus]